jgi:hypothetical protein
MPLPSDHAFIWDHLAKDASGQRLRLGFAVAIASASK